jgi:hypothetical protein
LHPLKIEIEISKPVTKVNECSLRPAPCRFLSDYEILNEQFVLAAQSNSSAYFSLNYVLPSSFFDAIGLAADLHLHSKHRTLAVASSACQLKILLRQASERPYDHG